MPWFYPSLNLWQNIDDEILGLSLICKTVENQLDPLDLYFDASAHQFPNPLLKKGQKINARFLYARKSAVYFELGHHFKWKHGSIITRIYKKDFPLETNWVEKNTGDEIQVYFKNMTEKGRFNFVPYPFKGLELTFGSIKWYKKEIFPVKVSVDRDGKQNYSVYGKFPALILKKRHNGEVTPNAEQRTFLASLKDGDVFDCLLIDITKDHTHFIVTLV